MTPLLDQSSGHYRILSFTVAFSADPAENLGTSFVECSQDGKTDRPLPRVTTPTSRVEDGRFCHRLVDRIDVHPAPEVGTMNDESELRDETVTDAAEDLELQDEAADGVGGGSVSRPIVSPSRAGGGDFDQTGGMKR